MAFMTRVYGLSNVFSFLCFLLPWTRITTPTARLLCLCLDQLVSCLVLSFPPRFPVPHRLAVLVCISRLLMNCFSFVLLVCFAHRIGFWTGQQQLLPSLRVVAVEEGVTGYSVPEKAASMD